MDKRWILILIVIIMAVVCGYFIVSSSNTVGNAIVDVNKFTVTVPPGFGIESSTADTTTLIKKGGVEKVSIKDLGKKDIALSEYNKKLKSMSKNGDIEIISNTTDSRDNLTIDTIKYQDYSKENLTNQSITYLYTYERTFSVKLTGFSDVNYMDDVLTFIADTLKPDYKKSQE